MIQLVPQFEALMLANMDSVRRNRYLSNLRSLLCCGDAFKWLDKMYDLDRITQEEYREITTSDEDLVSALYETYCVNQRRMMKYLKRITSRKKGESRLQHAMRYTLGTGHDINPCKEAKEIALKRYQSQIDWFNGRINDKENPPDMKEVQYNLELIHSYETEFRRYNIDF